MQKFERAVMKKNLSRKDIGLIMVVVGLCSMVLVFALPGCEDKELERAKSTSVSDANTNDYYTTDANTELIWITLPEETTCVNISFSGSEGFGVLFNWEDGKFDVTYDANNCTQSAKTFIDCMLPYLNEHIEEKAKELLEKEIE